MRIRGSMWGLTPNQFETVKAMPKGGARRCVVLILCCLAMLAGIEFAGSASMASAATQPSSVLLHTAGSFAVLAGSGITNTGPTTVNRDVGSFPTASETGLASVTFAGGSDQGGDALTQGAKNDLTTAYNDAAGRTPAANVPVELGGSTLIGGVYTHSSLGLTGALTLDGQGDPNAEFIFQTSSTLTTASNSRVLFINGANACHVVWQIGSSATFGTGTQFAGDVLAQTSITATTGATFQGRLLAETGAVTLDTNTITASDCATVPVTPPTTPVTPPTATVPVTPPATTPVKPPSVTVPVAKTLPTSLAPGVVPRTPTVPVTKPLPVSLTPLVGVNASLLHTPSTSGSTTSQRQLALTGTHSAAEIALAMALLLGGALLFAAGHRLRKT